MARNRENETSKPGRHPIPVEVQRERVLEAARRAFEPEDPLRFRIQDIVAAAGISTKTFYEVFGSRDALVIELAVQATIGLISELELIFAETLLPVERINRGVAVVVKAAERTPLFVRGLGVEAETILENQIDRILDTAIDLMLAAAQDAYDQGFLTRQPERLEYDVLIAGLARVIVRAHRQGSPPMAELQPGLVEILARHLK